ncbi:MAG: Lrp/AsnC family transcriptional regulator [Peptococcaceae bacterium]|jgi:Lrp/AsnC family leucine-responsive transcriptional regulator|nr:Lrp/AsnC family transcriptional regulator [Peptococcaceae bacterium]
MDTIDTKVLDRLMKNGRTTWAELGTLLDLSPPAAAERVRKLEERGVIKGYTALVDAPAVGCPLTAFIGVVLDRPRDREPFLEKVAELSAVQECHHVAGDEDYLLKVRASGLPELERLVSAELKGLPGVVKTRTTIVMSTVKETIRLPLPRGKE